MKLSSIIILMIVMTNRFLFAADWQIFLDHRANEIEFYSNYVLVGRENNILILDSDDGEIVDSINYGSKLKGIEIDRVQNIAYIATDNKINVVELSEFSVINQFSIPDYNGYPFLGGSDLELSDDGSILFFFAYFSTLSGSDQLILGLNVSNGNFDWYFEDNDGSFTRLTHSNLSSNPIVMESIFGNTNVYTLENGNKNYLFSLSGYFIDLKVDDSGHLYGFYNDEGKYSLAKLSQLGLETISSIGERYSRTLKLDENNYLLIDPTRFRVYNVPDEKYIYDDLTQEVNLIANLKINNDNIYGTRSYYLTKLGIGVLTDILDEPSELLYPNPGTNIFTLEGNIQSYILYNSTGDIVEIDFQHYSNKIIFNLESFPNGVYYLIANNITYKIIKVG